MPDPVDSSLDVMPLKIPQADLFSSALSMGLKIDHDDRKGALIEQVGTGKHRISIGADPMDQNDGPLGVGLIDDPRGDFGS